MFPLECVLERRVRSYLDDDLADNNLRLFILKCKHRKAYGYAADEIEMYNHRVKALKIGLRLGDESPAVSYLAIQGGLLFGEIVAVDETVIVIRVGFSGDGGRTSYLIYDALALSLRMIPLPESPSWIYTLSSRVSIARSAKGNGDAYALLHTGQLAGVDEADSIFMWRPSSSSRSPPWVDDYKVSSFPDLVVEDTDIHFSFNGSAYWVDLLCGVSYCSCNALLDNNNTNQLVEFGFIPLPFVGGANFRAGKWVARPRAYRTMGVAGNSIRFVSISGFQNHVKLENRTITVWKLMDRDQDAPWVLEHKLSLQTLWGFKGFGTLPKHLTPMYPLVSATNMDVVYLVLGECRENPSKGKFIPYNACHMIAVNMRKKTIKCSQPMSRSTPDRFYSCEISSSLRKALVGPCYDDGTPMKLEEEGTKKERIRKAPVGPCDDDGIPMKRRRWA